jgi:hypothetical protein
LARPSEPATSRARLPFAAKPLYEAPYAVFNLRLRVIAEQASSLRDIRESLRHVARLLWLALDKRVLVKLFFKERD